MTDNAVLRGFQELLDDERDALRAGRLDELQGFEARRNRLMAELPGAVTGLSPDRLETLRKGAQRNAELARAASEGVRDAIRRIGEIRKATGPIGSYGADGGRVEIGQPTPAVERKA